GQVGSVSASSDLSHRHGRINPRKYSEKNGKICNGKNEVSQPARRWGWTGRNGLREPIWNLEPLAMKALLCTRAGTPDDLTIDDVPDPVAGPGQAVVRVEAAALNFFDLLIIAGQYQYKPEYPFSPGAEFAGTVESIGPGGTGFAAGDRVIGYCGWGAAREKIAIDAGKLIKMPADLEPDRAAGLIVTYVTSYCALKDRAGLKRGETLAVLGATGGTGLAAVELGKLFGGRVIAFASSDEQLSLS